MMSFPKRDSLLNTLQNQTFDLLVIGGGATGAGIALDAASRGLTVALVERGDFASATSSRSTKLIHGGVRYLEKAVKTFDRKQLRLVTDALRERQNLLRIAPHLTRTLEIVTPVYSLTQLAYLWLGLKIYDRLSGRAAIGRSRFVSSNEVCQQFADLNPNGLKGGVRYFDGQFNDARMVIALVRTAIERGAVPLNHAQVEGLLKDGETVNGAVVTDTLTGQTFNVQSRFVINATGPYSDKIRRMDRPEVPLLIHPSSGTHLVLDRHYCPRDTGLLIPKTRDGRLMFILPWEGMTLVGTTDHPCPISDEPRPSEEDITFILGQLNPYLKEPVTSSDIRAWWTGIRPLARDPNIHGSDETASLVRDHHIEVAPSGLISIAGGKWTTYRLMAEEAVDRVLGLGSYPKRASQTKRLRLVGADGFSESLAEELTTEFPISLECARYLAHAYGGEARRLLDQADKESLTLLVHGHPYLLAEVDFAITEEYACTTMDILTRRLPLAMLDQDGAMQALPKVVVRLQKWLGWDDAKTQAELTSAATQLEQFAPQPLPLPASDYAVR